MNSIDFDGKKFFVREKYCEFTANLKIGFNKNEDIYLMV